MNTLKPPQPVAPPPTAFDLFNAGQGRQVAGDLEQARNYYLAALRVQPDLAGALTNLGGVMAAMDMLPAAIAYSRRAVALDMNGWGSHNNLGNLLWRAEQYGEAEKELRIAERLAPNELGVIHNIGLLLAYTNRHDEAVAYYDRYLKANPTSKAIQSDRAYAIMGKGDLLKALPAFEARWGLLQKTALWETPAPIWRGEELKDKTILVHHEQGFGDTFMFCRYLPFLKERGAKVLFAAPPELAALMALQPYIDKVVPFDGPFKSEPVDFQTPLMSIPLHLGKGSFTNTEPYIRLDRDYRELVRPRNLLIGMVWSTGMAATATPGLMSHESAKRRSYGLERLLPIAAIPGTQCLSLQKGAPAGDIAALGVEGIVENMDSQLGSWLDTAAAIQQLDLVISTDSAVINLAGALNVPAFLPLPFVTCWRWRNKPAWYGSVKFFRQEKPGDWGPVFSRIVTAVTEMQRNRSNG
jgi:hypothetical protein